MRGEKKTGSTVLRKCVQYLLFCACIIVVIPVAKTGIYSIITKQQSITVQPDVKSSIDIGTLITKQFRFTISSVEGDSGKTIIEGFCFLNDWDTPDYVILIDGKEAKTKVNGLRFRAEAPRIENKAEVDIRFQGYVTMPTGTWIKPTDSGFEVEFVAGVLPTIEGLPEGAVLRVWNVEHDVLVYVVNRTRMLWLIGEKIDRITELIYHIQTDEPEHLPEKRIQYGFDNRGFHIKLDERAVHELDPIGHYRVFSREIPDGYNITAIDVGLNSDGTIAWRQRFRY